MKKINCYICDLLMMLLVAISHLPFRVLYAFSDLLYYPLYHVVRYRRKIVRSNLTTVFPEKSEAEIRSIEKKFYHFFVDIVFECIKMVSITPDEMKRRMRFEGMDYVNGLLGQGKSISLYLGHYGNWEWVSSMGLRIGGDVVTAQVYRQLSNGIMDKLMKRLRERFGHVSVEMRSTARFINKTVLEKRPSITGFIADQSPKKRDAKYYVDFLSHKVPVLTGTERITKHFGHEALFLSVKRIERGYYVCEVSSLHPDPSSLPDFELTNLYFRQLEKEIMDAPSMYLWTHNRFKYAMKQ